MVRDTARIFYHALLDFIFPAECLVCRHMIAGEATLVCKDCWDRLPLLDEPTASIGSLQVASVWQYSEELNIIIHGMKYHHRKSLAGQIGLPMAELAAQLNLKDRYDCLVPVPLHPVRERERGYNQSALLADVVSERTGMVCLTGSLKRDKYTRAQAKLGKQKRLQNISNAFSCINSERWQDKRVVIVDDVVTTGATSHACAAVLLNAGVSEVFGLTAARTVKDRL